MYEKIKKWYESGYWTKSMVKNASKKGKITEEDYEEICNGTVNAGDNRVDA